MKPSLDQRLRNLRNFRIFTLGKKASFIFILLSMPLLRQTITFILKKYLLKSRYLDLDNYFNEAKPNYVVHPTVLDGIYCNELVIFSKKYNFKTIYIINSWDNTSTKNLLVNLPDFLFVWGQQTKKEAINFMGMERKKS